MTVLKTFDLVKPVLQHIYSVGVSILVFWYFQCYMKLCQIAEVVITKFQILIIDLCAYLCVIFYLSSHHLLL